MSDDNVIEKSAASPKLYTKGLQGRLVLSSSGWLLLEVPNKLMQGLNECLNEPGVEVPARADGTVNAHISVMSAEEVAKVGDIRERGRYFSFRPVGVHTIRPRRKAGETVVDAWEQVWFLTCHSKELKDLRVSYGLTPLPKRDQKFHITFAVRKKGAPTTKSAVTLLLDRSPQTVDDPPGLELDLSD